MLQVPQALNVRDSSYSCMMLPMVCAKDIKGIYSSHSLVSLNNLVLRRFLQSDLDHVFDQQLILALTGLARL